MASRTTSSSSITRTVPRGPGSAGAGRAGAGTLVLTGKSSRKTVPRPTSLSTDRPPLWPRTMPSTAARPRPRPVNFVVKKGSKTRSRVAASMPSPSSRTSSETYLPGGSGSPVCRQRWVSLGPTARAPVTTVTVPSRSPIASAAFVIRFMTTCWSWPVSASTGERPGVSSEARRTRLDTATRSRWRFSSMTVLSWTGRTWKWPRPE